MKFQRAKVKDEKDTLYFVDIPVLAATVPYYRGKLNDESHTLVSSKHGLLVTASGGTATTLYPWRQVLWAEVAERG